MSKKKSDKVEFETFRDIGSYEIGNLTQKEPSCFNGRVSVVERRVTIEIVEASVEVMTARLQKLWEDGDNFHHVEPIKAMAKRYGITLEGPYGSYHGRGIRRSAIIN